MVKIIFFSQILTFIVSKLYSVCFEKFFEVHYMSVCQKLTMLKFVPHPSHFWVSATSRLLLKRLCNSGGWSRAQMKAYDLICLENLSFGIFRAQELRYQGELQYLKKPGSNRVKGQERNGFQSQKKYHEFFALYFALMIMKKYYGYFWWV